MKKTIEEHAERFDRKAGRYDENKGPEYRTCADLVIAFAASHTDGVVLDLGCGTGAIGLSLAPEVDQVIGRDISEGMLDRAREKARKEGFENTDFAEGRFRAPNVDGPVDVVVSNFALHHLGDAEKRDAIRCVAGLAPSRFILGDVMFFDSPDPDEPFYDPAVDDPATVGVLADGFTDAGFALTAVEMVTEQVGVLVGDRHSREGEE